MAGYLHSLIGNAKKTSLYQVGVQTKHAQNDKHLNSTKRNINGQIRAICYWCNTLPCGRMLFVLQPFYSSCITFFTTPIVVFRFIFVSWNSFHHHLLVAYATPKNEAENPDFIRLLGQSLTKDLATIYAVAIWLDICIIGRATKRFGGYIRLTCRPCTLEMRNT